MEPPLAQQAIEEALKGNWDKAVEINLQIIKGSNSEDPDVLNRLSHAYIEIGEIKKAKEVNEKVLKIDPFNQIALKAFDKLRSLNKISANNSGAEVLSDTFLEEPGRTKIVNLIHVGDKSCLCRLAPGEKVNLVPHSHRVSVATSKNKYIGRLPDDLAAKLRKLIKLGNVYQTLIKTANEKEVKIFIREIHKSEKCKDIVSF